MQPSPSRRQQKKVRPPAKHGMSDEYLADILARLGRAIEEIQAKNASKLSFEELYRYAYQLCIYKRPEQLYESVTKHIIAHLDREAKYRIEPAFPTSTLLTSLASSSSSSSKAVANGSTSKDAQQQDARLRKISTTNGSTHETGQQGRFAQGLEGETFLNAFKGTWEDHKACMSKLRDVLKYMDKSYTPVAKVSPTYTLGLHLFLTNLLRNKQTPLAQTLLSVSLALIRIERDGEIINRGLLKTLTDMLCELREPSSEGRAGEGESVYKSWWEEKFLEETRTYYAQEAESNLEHCSAPEFLLRVDRRLQEESERLATFLHTSTNPLLFSLLDQVLIADNLQAVITHPNSGLPFLLADDKVEDLKRMYRLFSRVGQGHPVMMRAIKAWLIEQGARIAEMANSGSSPAMARVTGASAVANGAENVGAENEDEGTSSREKGKGKAKEADAGASAKSTTTSAATANNAAIEWVTAVLTLKDKMDRLWVEAFDKDRHFQNAVNDAFVTFVNDVKKAPEYISIFLDENMRRGVKGKTEAEVDAILDKTIVVFRYLTDKDVFEDYYKRHLAKRLYFGRSLSDDAERGMLQKLKLECGAQFVTKLEGMLKDVGFSEDLNSGYRRYVEGLGSGKPVTELSVQVCTSSFWPNTPDVPCILPSELAKITKSFERYFDTRYTGRKLSWHPEHGSVDVKVRFDKGNKEINVATHGMVVLAHFESLSPGETLSYTDLSAATGLPDSHLKRTLQSLACAKYKILKKDPPTRNVSNTDKFSFNHAFTAPMVRLKIQTIANRVENSEETKETDDRVDKERSQVIEAALVRIMKNRKQLSHSELVNEVTQQLSRRFTPKVTMVKLAMERLIEKDYLERDDKDRKLLRYLA